MTTMSAGRSIGRVAIAAFTVAALGLSAQAVTPRDAAHAEPTQARKVSQRATISIVPSIAQRGRTKARPGSRTQLVARFSPALPGRKVQLQRKKDDGTWKTLRGARQDRTGHVVFDLPRPDRVYRAQAPATSSSPEATSRGARAKDYELLFSDTFGGKRLRGRNWSDKSLGGERAYMRHCSKPHKSARSVRSGLLHLGVRPNPKKKKPCRWNLNGNQGTHPHMYNSQIDTQGKFSFRYGFAAARIKTQRDKGMHSAFWLQPEHIQIGAPRKGTEIDVMEFFGRTKDGQGTIASYVHWYDTPTTRKKRGGLFPAASLLKPAGDTWWNSYHVFSVEWTPNAYIFRVDGREYHRETKAVSRVDQYLILSMLTSDYELKNLTPQGMQQTAAVDWVRVWGH